MIKTKNVQYAIKEHILVLFDDGKWRRKQIMGFHSIGGLIYIMFKDSMIGLRSGNIRKAINGQRNHN